MRSPVLGLLLLALAARPAFPGAILYVSATGVNPGGGDHPRIDAYCLDETNGGIAQTLAFQYELAESEVEPRRVLVHPTLGNVLYVAQRRRISVFQISDTGRLTPAPNGTIPVRDPRDLAIWGNTLYASLHQGTIVGFQLNADGTPCAAHGQESDQKNPYTYTTCIDSDTSGAYQDLAIDDGDGDSSNGALVYVTGGGDFGRIDVFQLASDGTLLDASGAPQACVSGPLRPCDSATTTSSTTTTSTTATTLDSTTTTTLPARALSLRRDLARPKALQIKNGILYVAEKSRNRIVAFQLQPNGFCQCSDQAADGTVVCNDAKLTTNSSGKPRCLNDAGKLKKDWVQPLFSKTAQVDRYQSLLLVGSTLVGTQYNEGRLDSYLVATDGKLPKRPKRRGSKDLRRSPVRMAAYPGRTDLVYVAGGILDQVLAFKVNDKKGLIDPRPFSATPVDRNSFPNDAAVAVFTGDCR